jgi:mxaD protein
MKVKMETTVNAFADKVWETMGNFNGVPEFVASAVNSCVQGEGIGMVRTLTLSDGGEIIERLEEYNSENKMLKYSIVTSPLPVDNYVSTVKVLDMGDDRCKVEWMSTFDAKGASETEAKSVIEGIYSMGFNGLHKLHG